MVRLRSRKQKVVVRTCHWLLEFKRQENPVIEVLETFQDDDDGVLHSLTMEEQVVLWGGILKNFKYHIKCFLPRDDDDDDNDDDDSDFSSKEDECEKKKEKAEKRQLFVSAVVEAVTEVLQLEKPYLGIQLVEVIRMLEKVLVLEVVKHKTKLSIVRLFEAWIHKTLFEKELLTLSSLHYLLQHSLQPGAVKVDVLNLWKSRELFTHMCLTDVSCQPVVKLVLEVPRRATFLKMKEGRNLLAFIMQLSIDVAMRIHKVIKSILPSCKRSEAEAFGQVYYLAWHHGESSIREFIEKKFQNYMYHFFTFPRHGKDLSPLGCNIFMIARYFHAQRSYLPATKMISKIYSTLLFMFLEDGSNNNRCNAVQVLMDAYPLEKPGSGREQNSLFLGEQHRFMTKFLTDPCSIIRNITCRQLCIILSEYWVTIDFELIDRWLSIIIEDLANDASDVSVRCSVYWGLQRLLSCSQSEDYLKGKLPLLHNNFHDTNDRVRLSFANMLLAIKRTRLKFWHIVPIDHIIFRLKLEKEEIGMKYVDLIFDSFYAPHFEMNVVIRRLARLTLIDGNASRKFFQYSQKRLPWHQAVDLMLSLLAYLRAHVKDKLEADDSKDTAAFQSVLHNSPRSKSKKRLYSGKENVDIGNVPESDGKCSGGDMCMQNSLENPLVIQGYLDGISILWCIHSVELNKEENAEMYDKLTKMCVMTLPLLVRYYKDSSLFSSVLYLCSLVPANILRPVCMVESICLARIQKLSMVNPSTDMAALVQALCFWDRAVDIIDIVRHWINDAYHLEKIEGSLGGKRNRRVQFRQEPKPRLGLHLLAAMLDHPLSKCRVLEKNYKQLMDLWLFLSKIKTLIARRMENGQTFTSPLLCDHFLFECFEQYVLLMPTLGSRLCPNREVESCSELASMFVWATEIILPHVPHKYPKDPNRSSNVNVSMFSLDPLPILFVRTLLLVATNMIAVEQSTPHFCCATAKFALAALSTGCTLMFVHPTMQFVENLIVHVKRHYVKDELNLFRSVAVTVVMKCLDAFGTGPYVKNTVDRLVKNFTDIRTNLIYTLATFKLYNSEEARKRLMRSLMRNIVLIISHEVKELNSVRIFKDMHSLPYVASHLLSTVHHKALASVFLCQLKAYLSEDFREEPSLLVASMSLLLTLTFCPGSLQQKELVEVLEVADRAIGSYVEKTKSLAAAEHVDTSVSKLDVVGECKVLKKEIRAKLLGTDCLEPWEVNQLVRNQLDWQSVD